MQGDFTVSREALATCEALVHESRGRASLSMVEKTRRQGRGMGTSCVLLPGGCGRERLRGFGLSEIKTARLPGHVGLWVSLQLRGRVCDHTRGERARPRKRPRHNSLIRFWTSHSRTFRPE